jgi:hypothetical protein
MLGGQDSGRIFGFAKLLLVIAFGYTMIAFYESPTIVRDLSERLSRDL